MNIRHHSLRNTEALLIGVILVAATIGYFKFHKARVSNGNSEKLASLIQVSVAAAGAKNEQALRLCETEINTILAQQFPELIRQGQIAAADISSYGSCCKIIYFLARD